MIIDQTFKNQNYIQTRLPKSEYENCIFEGCNFSDGYLDNQNFMECEFIDCNLSNTNIAHTIFKEVTFLHCKMMGLKFEDCNDFLMDFSFHECTLDFSSFYGLTLKRQQFIECKMLGVDFADAELMEALFDGCDLKNTVFQQTNLEKADFRTALNFNIDPENNRIKKAKFSKEGALGLLNKYGINIG